MTGSDTSMICGEETRSIRLLPRDFLLTDEGAACINDDGVLDVPAGVEAFLLYGPRIRIPDAIYEIEVVLEEQADGEPLAVVDVFDGGRVHAEATLPLARPLRFAAHETRELEIRIRAIGRAFRLSRVILRQALSPSRMERVIAAGRAHAGDAPVTPVEHMWRMLHLPAGTVDAADAAGDLDQAGMEAWARRAVTIVQMPPTAIDIAETLAGLEIDRDALALAARHDRDLELLYARCQSNPQLARKIKDQGDPPVFASYFMRQLARHPGHFQVSALTEGAISLPCPFTGLLVRSRHSFPVATDETKQVHIFYRFESTEIFYLAVGNFTATKVFIYHPRTETVFHLHDTEMAWGVSSQIIDAFRRLMVTHGRAVLDYLRSDTHRTLLVDVTNNLGHVFWNDGGGIFEADRSGLLAEVDRAIRYRFRLFDTLALANRRFDVVDADDADELMRLALQAKAFCVRPASIAFPQGLPQRIRQVSLARCSDLVRRRMAVARRATRLVWVNLRAHNKVWRNQVDGIVGIAEFLAARHETVAFLLDGTPDCEALADEIGARLPPNLEAYDGLSLSIYESAAFATIVDYYVATIGSGLTLVTWVAERPGVAHSERAHLGQLDFWGEVQPQAPMPLAPLSHQIEELGTGMYCDYLIEPDVMIDLVRRIDEACDGHA